MRNKDILKIIEKNKEYIEKFNFILRHRNNLSVENPTFDDHNSQYAELHKKVMEDYSNWLEKEVE